MTAPEARKLTGQRVEWDESRRIVRGYSMPWRDAGSGVINEVRGKNVLIGDDWLWLPYLRNLRAASAKAL